MLHIDACRVEFLSSITPFVFRDRLNHRRECSPAKHIGSLKIRGNKMKRLILAISVLLVLGLAVAAIAYNRSAVVETAMSCCCCSGDSCPMKKDGTATADSCCNDGCCKDGSCAMTKDGAAS